jgi:hypothetical protein
MTKQNKKVKVKKPNAENQIIKTVDNIVVYF